MLKMLLDWSNPALFRHIREAARSRCTPELNKSGLLFTLAFSSKFVLNEIMMFGHIL